MIEAWKITCEGGPCRAFFSLTRENDVVLTFALLRDRVADKVTAVIRVPTGVALPPGLRLEIEPENSLDGAFQVCEADGCTAILPLDAAAQAALATKTTVRVLFVSYGEANPVAFEVPITGFAEALDAL